MGHLYIDSKPPEARRVMWNNFFLIPLRENQFCQHLDFLDFYLDFITVRQYISIVLIHPVCSTRKLVQRAVIRPTFNVTRK